MSESEVEVQSKAEVVEEVLSDAKVSANEDALQNGDVKADVVKTTGEHTLELAC